MTDQTAQEPTMEEILASIRRIISEDDAPAETAAPAASAPEATPAPQTEPEPEPVVSSALMDETPSTMAAQPDEDVLDLTDRYEAPAEISTIGDLDVGPAADPFPAQAPVSESIFAPQVEPTAEPEHPARPTPFDGGGDALVGAAASASAASAFAGLRDSFRQPEPNEPPMASGPTLDELARSLLRPMLKEWLDANLPAIVEAQVRKEVERIARNAG